VDVIDALDETFRHTQGVIAGVRAEQYGDKTPCTEWTVRDLLEHMIGVVAGLGAAAAGSPGLSSNSATTPPTSLSLPQPQPWPRGGGRACSIG
jgi:Mycothiol maleylpyruvate isomerase N-terminal domain